MPRQSGYVFTQEARRKVGDMVNRSKRLCAKSLLERFLACQITNDDFNDSFPCDKADGALEAIYCNIWPYYSENRTHKLDGKHALQPEVEELFRRCVVFLASNLEYEWPPYEWIDLKYGFMRLFASSKKIDDQFERFKARGEFAVWPFIRQSDYLACLRRAGSPQVG